MTRQAGGNRDRVTLLIAVIGSCALAGCGGAGTPSRSAVRRRVEHFLNAAGAGQTHVDTCMRTASRYGRERIWQCTFVTDGSDHLGYYVVNHGDRAKRNGDVTAVCRDQRDTRWTTWSDVQQTDIPRCPGLPQDEDASNPGQP